MPRPHHRQNPGTQRDETTKQAHSVQQLLASSSERHCDGCLITSLWTDTHIHTKRHKHTHTHKPKDKHPTDSDTKEGQTPWTHKDKHPHGVPKGSSLGAGKYLVCRELENNSKNTPSGLLFPTLHWQFFNHVSDKIFLSPPQIILLILTC